MKEMNSVLFFFQMSLMSLISKTPFGLSFNFLKFGHQFLVKIYIKKTGFSA